MNVAEDADMLPVEEWLQKAKALPIGRQDRTFHRREKRPNLVIWNQTDRWSCYCQSCKEGGVVMKEHVRLGGESPESKHSDLTLPADMIGQAQWEAALETQIARFLSEKGMDLTMLPSLWYSCTRKRLLVQTPEGWMGRDVTGNALEKWLTYSGQHYLMNDIGVYQTVLVEDAFSFFKVVWAMQYSYARWNVMCALGTGMKPSIVARLMQQNRVRFMFDGDAAGVVGAEQGVRRLAPFCDAKSVCAPWGFDPKDLTAVQIVELLKEII